MYTYWKIYILKKTYSMIYVIKLINFVFRNLENSYLKFIFIEYDMTSMNMNTKYLILIIIQFLFYLKKNHLILSKNDESQINVTRCEVFIQIIIKHYFLLLFLLVSSSVCAAKACAGMCGTNLWQHVPTYPLLHIYLLHQIWTVETKIRHFGLLDKGPFYISSIKIAWFGNTLLNWGRVFHFWWTVGAPNSKNGSFSPFKS